MKTMKTTKDFYEYKEAVLENCPRGEEYFCDGTPNLSVENMDNARHLGKCKYRQNGRCTVMEKVVMNNDSERMDRERI